MLVNIHWCVLCRYLLIRYVAFSSHQYLIINCIQNLENLLQYLSVETFMPCSLFVSTETYYLISNQTTFFTRYQALCSKSRNKFWFDISFRMIRSVQKTYFTNYQQNTNKNVYQLFGQLSTKFIQMPQTNTKKAINLLNSIFKWTLWLTSHGQLYLLRCWFVLL